MQQTTTLRVLAATLVASAVLALPSLASAQGHHGHSRGGTSIRIGSGGHGASFGYVFGYGQDSGYYGHRARESHAYRDHSLAEDHAYRDHLYQDLYFGASRRHIDREAHAYRDHRAAERHAYQDHRRYGHRSWW